MTKRTAVISVILIIMISTFTSCGNPLSDKLNEAADKYNQAETLYTEVYGMFSEAEFYGDDSLSAELADWKEVITSCGEKISTAADSDTVTETEIDALIGSLDDMIEIMDKCKIVFK